MDTTGERNVNFNVIVNAKSPQICVHIKRDEQSMGFENKLTWFIMVSGISVKNI